MDHRQLCSVNPAPSGQNELPPELKVIRDETEERARSLRRPDLTKMSKQICCDLAIHLKPGVYLSAIFEVRLVVLHPVLHNKSLQSSSVRTQRRTACPAFWMCIAKLSPDSSNFFEGHPGVVNLTRRGFLNGQELGAKSRVGKNRPPITDTHM